MYCPRYKHFARLNEDGTVSRCGHMVDAPRFQTYEDMESSKWATQLRQLETPPNECVRCQSTELASGTSIRIDAIRRGKLLETFDKDYLVIGGVLDNVCNSACQFCWEGLSTTIGSLKKNIIKLENVTAFDSLPKERIIELDINGGEPSYSKNYKRLLKNLPPNVKIVRINTNGTQVIDNLEELLARKIKVIITLSFDGTERVNEYARYPVKWKKWDQIVNEYKHLADKYSNLELGFWSTLNVFTINDLENMLRYADNVGIGFSYGLLEYPEQMSIKYTNPFTEQAKEKFEKSDILLLKQLAPLVASSYNNTNELVDFVTKQDELRSISYRDYFEIELGEKHGQTI
jgi:sulfatase maturation enzyme AslB (radical SAM superfamily)